MNKLIASIFFVILALGCTSTSDSNVDHNEQNQITSEITAPLKSYVIISEEKSETPGKAQLLEYAVYLDSVYTETALKEVVMDIYNQNKNKKVFEDHVTATVIGVYLFTSKEASEDKSNWIAMLIKRPSEEDPDISLSDSKIKALYELTDNIKSKDEMELERINTYLNKRGLDLCNLSDQLKKIELDNINKADAKYPHYGKEHTAMVEKLDEAYYRNLKRKHNLNDEMIVRVWIFAMSYCK